jgi:hypothetical protein
MVAVHPASRSLWAQSTLDKRHKANAGMKAPSSLRLVCLRCAGKDIETTLVYSGDELKGFLEGGLLKCLLTT